MVKNLDVLSLTACKLQLHVIPHLKALIDGCLELEVQGYVGTFTLCHALAPCGISYGKAGLCLLRAQYTFPALDIPKHFGVVSTCVEDFWGNHIRVPWDFHRGLLGKIQCRSHGCLVGFLKLSWEICCGSWDWDPYCETSQTPSPHGPLKVPSNSITLISDVVVSLSNKDLSL